MKAALLRLRSDPSYGYILCTTVLTLKPEPVDESLIRWLKENFPPEEIEPAIVELKEPVEEIQIAKRKTKNYVLTLTENIPEWIVGAEWLEVRIEDNRITPELYSMKVTGVGEKTYPVSKIVSWEIVKEIAK